MSPRYVSHEFFPSRPEGTKDIVEDNSKEEQIIKEKRLNVCCHRQIAYVSYHWFEQLQLFWIQRLFFGPWHALTEEKHIVSKAESLELALYKMQELHSKSVGTSQDATRYPTVTVNPSVIFSMHKQSLVTSIFTFYSFCISSCSRFGT